MLIPTMRVRVKSSGHHVDINVSDFDPDVHVDITHEVHQDPPGARVVSASGTTSQPVADDLEVKQGQFDPTPGTIATVNMAEALELIQRAQTPEDLNLLEAAERASDKNAGGRRGVFRAINARRLALRS